MHSNSLKNRVKSCQTQPIMNFIMMCVYFVSIFFKKQTIQHECIKHLNQMNVSFILFFEVKKLIIHMRHNTLLAKISCALHTQLRMFSCNQLRILYSRTTLTQSRINNPYTIHSLILQYQSKIYICPILQYRTLDLCLMRNG